MIIDSHVHYSHHLYEGEYRYIGHSNGKPVLSRSDRQGMLADLQECGVDFCIEPSTHLSLIDHQLDVVDQHSPYLRFALGVHPKYCHETTWGDRERLREYVLSHNPIAIGETGLDYSVEPSQLKKLYQKMWFFYQIRLADEMHLPLILHFRDAYPDGLKLLTRHRDMLHGGVTHCFSQDYQTAMDFIDLGFAIGIGGKLLSDNDEGLRLQDTVRRIPLESIIVETDAPYIKPNLAIESCSPSQRNKARNSSAILHTVIDKIAELRGENRDFVEETIYRTTLHVFQLSAN